MSAADWKARSNRGLPGRERQQRPRSIEDKRLELLIESARWEREQVAVRIARATLRGAEPKAEDTAAFERLEQSLTELECRRLIGNHLADRQYNYGY